MIYRIESLLDKVYSHHRTILSAFDRPDPELGPDLVGLEKVATKDDRDLHVLAMRENGGASEEELKRRQQAGDWCYRVIDQGRCVHYSWLTQSSRHITGIGFKAELPAHQAWIYDCYTAPSHRGQGLYPRVVQRISREMMQSGTHFVWIDTQDSNQRSFRGIRRAGFREIGFIERTRIFQQTTWNRISLDPNTPFADAFSRIPCSWT